MRAAVIFAQLVIAVLILMAGSPRAHTQVAVMVSPFSAPSTAAEVVAAAGGTLVGSSRFSFIVLAGANREDFVAALYGAGALLVFDPAITAGCLSQR